MNPFNEYKKRRERWTLADERWQKRSTAIGNWRLLVAIVFLFLAWLVWGRNMLSAGWLLLPVAAFVALAVWHSRVVRKRDFAQKAIVFYDQGLARLSGRWMGTGPTGERFLNPEHVYAGDLDVFGKGSLFQFVSTAGTGVGELTLAKWFLKPGDSNEVSQRQAAVRELTPKLDLREDLALLGEEVGAGAHIEHLDRWGCAPPVHFQWYLRPLALFLAIIGVLLILAFFAQLLPLWPFVTVLGCDFILIVALRKRVAKILGALETPAQELSVLSLVLKRLERETFQSPQLQKLRGDIDATGRPASQRIARLQRWVAMIDSSDHLLIRAIRPMLLWQEQLAMGVEAWRTRNGAHVGNWLRAVGELEALSSLASLAFERPDWSFPVLTDNSRPLFEGKALRHPLLPQEKCVPNDVQLGGIEHCDLLIVSGSNMSGKSTLLRSVGLNTVLAWAGAPVAANHLRISPLQIGASLRVVDSLQDGRSRFMAEITRLRQIVELTKGPLTVLFLLDELLSGTNSHDRRIGAAAIVGGLLQRGAIGLMTTHDLALADLETHFAARAGNVHFEDQMADGQMQFDYRLRPGVVTRSNALELMRAVGLDV